MGVETEEIESGADDIRADIRAAIAEPAGNDNAEVPANDDAEPAESAPKEKPSPSNDADSDSPPGKAGERARDESGRFAKAKESKQPEPRAPQSATPPAPKAAPPVAASTPPPPQYKPPQSWTPAAREKWSGIPAEIQAEIDRREREAATGIKTHADKARLADEYESVAQSYRPMLGNIPAPQAFASLLQAQYVLTQGTPHQKAQGFANLINQSGVPLELVNQYLSGTTPPQGGQATQTVDPNAIAAQIRQQVMQDLQAQRAQASTERARRDLEEFGAKNEFFNDVRQDMADLMEMSARRGIVMTPAQAYERATQMHPEISRVLRQREEAARANASQASTQRIRNAASSVKPNPSGGVVTATKSGNIADDIQEAVRKLSGR